MSTTTGYPRIYVACLASYNNGVLYGRWIDVDGDGDDIRYEVDEMLAQSPAPGAEEWAIHDHEGWPVSVSESHDFDELAALAELLDDYDEDVIRAACDVSDDETAEELRGTIEDRYCGAFDREGDYAEEFATGCYDIPEHLQYYIDYEKMERDLELGGDISRIEINGVFHIFTN
jgi:antirestriction protein